MRLVYFVSDKLELPEYYSVCHLGLMAAEALRHSWGYNTHTG